MARPFAKSRGFLFGLTLSSLVLSLATAEILLRRFVYPSPEAFGLLGGHVLPPRILIPIPQSPDREPDQWYRGVVVNGRKMTRSDLSGIMEEHSVIGYIPTPNVRSTHGWWHSNNLGARSATATSRHVPSRRIRIAVFGESFTQGSRLPDEETWTSRLAALDPRLEVVNFGVEGYSTGQSLLRYEQIRTEIDYDIVMFMFVPRADLWRDLNTIRHLGIPSWQSYALNPRFEMADGEPKLVPIPYVRGTDVYKKNYLRPTPELRTFLSEHDRFYNPIMFDDHGIFGRLVLTKLVLSRLDEWRTHALWNDINLNPQSEAMMISGALLKRARMLADHDARKFVLAVLPVMDEIEEVRRTPSTVARWRSFVAAASAGSNSLTIDLLPALLERELDRAYDGTHFGPRTTKLIAAGLYDSLQRLVSELSPPGVPR